MQPEDIAAFTTVSPPRLHPDGSQIVFHTSQMDLESDLYRRALWLWDGQLRQLTYGPSDTEPRWSPDGTRIAFLRKSDSEGAKPQVAVIPVAGGEAEVITDFPLGVKELAWAPDGSTIAALATTWTDEWADLDSDERDRRPRRITQFVFRSDNHGWIHDRRNHYYLVDAMGAEDPRRIGDGEASEAGLGWSPDGKRVAYLTLVDDPQRMQRGVDLVEMSMEDGARRVVAPKSGFIRAVYRPDGELHAIGGPQPDYPALVSLWRLGETPADLTSHVDRSIFSFLQPPDMAIPHWLQEGFLIGRVDSGRIHLVEFADDGSVSTTLGGDRYITGFARDQDGVMYFSATDPTSPGEIYRRLPDGEEAALTAFNADFRRDTELAEPDHYRVETVPGVEVDTWLFVPEGDGPFPVLLNIHGGPASQYGFSFFDEFQVYHGAGYAVLACNPRGSSGRGAEWLQAVTKDGWGTVDIEDVTAVVEDALAREPRLDPARLGMMGGSYGGFLTSWVIARDHRYRAAVVERALVSWESFSGTSDIARDFSDQYLGAVPPRDHPELRRASPLDRADDIRTPTLILHSEEDYRCPIEQAEQLFSVLMRNGVDTELIRFPGESHELSRSGTPRHRRERFDAILDWLARHLT